MRNRILRFVIYGAVGVVTGLIVAGVVVLAEKVLLEDILHRSLWQQALAPARTLDRCTSFEVFRRRSPVVPIDVRGIHPQLQQVTRLESHSSTVSLNCWCRHGWYGRSGRVRRPGYLCRGDDWFCNSTTALLAVRRQRWAGITGSGSSRWCECSFQAPATGVLFALESPYKGDLGRRALLPALLSALRAM